MKKTLFISNIAYPLGNVTSKRIHFLCKGLVENGVDLNLLLIKPTECKKNINNKNYRGVNDNVKYSYAISSTVRHENKLLAKIIDYYCHIKVLKLIFINKEKYDSVIINGPFYDFRIFYVFLLSLKKVKIHLEVNELSFVSNKEGLFKNLKIWIWHKFLFPLFDGFIAITDSLKEELNKYKSKKSKVIVVPIIGEKICNTLINQTNSPLNSPYIFHAGSLSEVKDGILGIIKAFAKYKREVKSDLKYVFTGNINNAVKKNEISQLLKDNDLENEVLFVGFLTEKHLIEYLKHAKMAIINKYTTKQNEYCFATKIIDYINYEIPIILTNIHSHKLYFKDGFNAFIVEPNKYEYFPQKISFIIKNEETIKDVTRNAKKLLDKEFNYLFQTKRIINFFVD